MSLFLYHTMHFLIKIVKCLLYPMAFLFTKLLRVDKIYYSYRYDTIDSIPVNIKYCLIPGAMLYDNGALPPILVERLKAAVNLYSKRPDMHFILSGDGSKRISNDVNAMYRYLKLNSHIPDVQITLDHKGLTSLDSFQNLAANPEYTEFILLTSAFHAPRCTYIAHKLGLKPYVLHLAPKSKEAAKLYGLREYLAIIKTWYILTYGKPAFHGKLHRFWYSCALLAGKLLYFLLRLLRFSATTLPGRLTITLCPYALQYLTEHLSLVLITGTNGKTSTVRLVEHALRAADIPFISNHSSANLRSGITTALLTNCHFSGHYDVEYAILECDEDHLPRMAQHFTSKTISLLVTNLSSDQLNRLNSVEDVRESILSAIENLPTATIYLNADCPYTVSMGEQIKNTVYRYGITSKAEITLIPEKDTVLFIQVPSGQITCPGVTSSIAQYNGLAASTILYGMNLTDYIPCCFHSDIYNPGRMEQVQIENCIYTIFLVKNPVSFRASLDALPEFQGNGSLVFAISDSGIDIENMTWLWDTDLSPLLGKLSLDTGIYCCGTLRYNTALRLVHVGIPEERIHIEPDFQTLYPQLASKETQVHILCNYENMMDIRNHFRKFVPIKNIWE